MPINVQCLLVLLLQIAATALSNAATATPGSPGYAIVRHIKAPGADVWDYAAVDPETRRLYLAQSGVLALDLETGQSVRLAQAPMIHGVIPIGRGRLAIADSTANAVVVLASATGTEIARIPTGKPPNKAGWQNPDALVLEPTSGLLAAVNSDSGTVLLIDLERAAVAATIRVGGKLEFAVADGEGRLFVNIASENALAVLDVARRKTVKRISLKGCEEPSGLAYDSKDHLLLPVCGNGVVPVVDAKSGLQVATVKVGKGADAVVYDAARRVAFVPAGADATLTVIAVRGASDIAVVQTLPTKRGVRLGALDARTGALYLPSAEFGGAPVRLPGLRPFPGVTPGTFEFLVVARK
jgi:DNA-binding beta-propeller fold protein YncE